MLFETSQPSGAGMALAMRTLGEVGELYVHVCDFLTCMLTLLHGYGVYIKYSALWLCIVPPFGWANTAILKPYCPHSHAIISRIHNETEPS